MSTKLVATTTMGYVVVADVPGTSPQSLDETVTLKGSALDQTTETLKRGDGGGTNLLCFPRDLAEPI